MKDLKINYEESKLYAMNTFAKSVEDVLNNNFFTAKHSFEDFIKETVDDPNI